MKKEINNNYFIIENQDCYYCLLGLLKKIDNYSMVKFPQENKLKNFSELKVSIIALDKQGCVYEVIDNFVQECLQKEGSKNVDCLEKVDVLLVDFVLTFKTENSNISDQTKK